MADQEIDIEGIQKALDELQDKFGISDKALSAFTKAVKKTANDFQKELSNLNKEIVKGKKGYEDQLKLLKNLDDAIEELTESMEDEQDATKKLAAEQTKAALLAQRDSLQTSASIRGLGEATAKATTSMALAGVKGAGDFVKGLQSNASGIDLAAGLMNAGIDVATAGVKGLGAGATAVAPMLMRFGPAGMVAGAALALLGIAAETGADSLNKLAKFGVEVLQKEAEKTFKAFNSMNASGAMFTDGMTGMVNAAGAAGLTVDAFSKVVQENQSAIAASGLGMTEGVKQMGRISSDLKKSGVQNQLMKLGFSLEEQAGLISETTANMRKAAGGTVTDQEVAEQTKKYAENLRLIASITGEDAKKKVEAAAAAANELIFQQKLAGKSNEQRAQINAAMATMSEQERKNFIDRVALGEVINKEGAIYEATVGGAREKGEAALRLFDQNALTAKTNSDLNAKYGEQINKNIIAQEAIGMAAHAVGGDLATMGKGMVETMDNNNKYTKKAVAEGNKNLAGAGNTGDKLTNGLIGAEQAAYDLKIALQKELLPAVTNFAVAAEQILKGTRKMLDELGLGDPERRAREAAEEKALKDEYRKKHGSLGDYMLGQDKAAYERKKAREEEISKMSEEDAKKARESDQRTADLSKKSGARQGPSIYEQMLANKQIEYRADGGPVDANKPYVVGEQGPEVIVPNSSGTVLNKEQLEKLKTLSVGQLTSQAMTSIQGITSEGKGSIAGYFLEAANALKNDNGVWTLGGEVVDQNTAREILDFARGWPKLKQEIQGELDKAKAIIGEGGSKLDASMNEGGYSTKMSDYATGFAKGGIASGSLSGYSATLHGTEAVVPLPDNKSIPVNLDGSALSGALQAQSDILNNILSAMQQNNKYASGLLQASM